MEIHIKGSNANRSGECPKGASPSLTMDKEAKKVAEQCRIMKLQLQKGRRML